MSHTVRLLPDGREFSAEPQETLLEAALRSGIDLQYGCAGGTCGECKARVVSGQLGAAEFHDYVLTDAEKAQGVVLLCRSHAATDLVIEADEVRPGDIPLQRLTARIAGMERHGDYLLLQLRTPRTRTLRFLAGQSVVLSVPGIGSRSLAVASCPCNGMLLQFHLHAGEYDPLTRHLFATARLSDAIEVEGPVGRFTLDESSTRPLVMVAEGTGFAPIKSLIEHYIALDMPQTLYLFWLTETGGHYLANLCRAWHDALDRFEFRLMDTEEREAPARAIRRELPAVGPADWYLATGPCLAGALASGRSPEDSWSVYGQEPPLVTDE